MRASFFLKARKLNFRSANANELREKLIGFFIIDNEAKGLAIPEYKKIPFAFQARTPDGCIAASCAGYSAWGELHVDLLGANPEVKLPGAGKTMMHAVEKLARERGCSCVALDTYSWQARPFYERIGFNVFGAQKNYPVGHEKYFMEKRWDPSSRMDDSVYDTLPRDISVLESDQTATEELLFDLLENNTQSRKIPGVPSYVKDEFAIEARSAEDDSFVAGAVFETLWGEMHVSFLGTHSDLKKQGQGSLMLKKLEEVAREKGCNRMSLETMSWQAQPFYEKHNFRPFGVQSAIPLNDTKRIYMEKLLQ